MSPVRQGRYSVYIRPISYAIDLAIIGGFWFFLFNDITPKYLALLFLGLAWILTTAFSGFYNVYRYTKEVTIVSLILKQFIFFALVLYALSGIFYKLNTNPYQILKYLGVVIAFSSLAKFGIFYFLKTYRSSFGKNYRNTVIFGNNKSTKALEDFFNNQPQYGYAHKKTFSVSNFETLANSFQFIKNNHVDEIYCSVSQLSSQQLNDIIDFADNNLKTLKLIPDGSELYSKRLNYEYYSYIPILSFRTIALDEQFNKVIKRIFDILFSSFVIIFILSWLTPILAILIKLESRGPVFFKQSRNGFNYEEFDCYKYRSMRLNATADIHQVSRNDSRVTKIGKFIRRTSIDELPQFFNVLFGDMSVVGPRPHMVSHTDMYAKKVDKFMVRHFVKPGITGLAQVKGFRGEVETDQDIINRVKYDIFYIENWSLLLDLKITLQTFINAVRGEEKAY